MSIVDWLVTVAYTMAFALCGVCVAELAFTGHRFARRLWLGLVLGLFMFTWLPALFAFFVGFNLLSQILGLVLAIIIAVLCLILSKKHRPSHILKGNWLHLPLLLVIFFIGCYLFSTHILFEKNGNFYAGQTTYGDLSMHLSFISSIAQQGFFPPEYSLFVGYPMSYPFLCEVSSSTLLILGAELRVAYLLPALWAYALVILGVYNLFELWLKREGRATFSTLAFFIGGGFGFIYFIDLINKNPTALQSLLNTGTNNNMLTLMEGFYQTPTNIPDMGLRWVNPIVDMLIPQRATLFGWAMLFAALFLVVDYMRNNRSKNLIPLGIIAGGLPLIHTHSFVALALVSAVFFFWDIACCKKNKKKILGWLIYASIAVVLALPQLICFTFRQTSQSNMLQVWLNWGNGNDSFLWFYLKNCGWVFALMPFGFLCLSKDDRKLFSGVLLLWLVSELIIFQPNNYDNNKLLFIWYAFGCGLMTKLVASLYHRLNHKLNRLYGFCTIDKAKPTASAVIKALILVYLVMRPLSQVWAKEYLALGTVITMVFLLGLCLTLNIKTLLSVFKERVGRLELILSLLSPAISLAVILALAVRFVKTYSMNAIDFDIGMQSFMIVGLFTAMVADVLLTIGLSFKNESIHNSLQDAAANKPKAVFALKRIALSLSAYVFCVTLFVSGVMTIAREANSEYMIFSDSQIEAAEFIKNNTNSGDIFLTDYAWHLNPVAALAGRSIVCGTDTYLVFHGIDTSQRKQHVNLMYTYPKNNLYLFNQYNVKYVYIGHDEHANGQYSCDIDYFESNCTRVYSKDGIAIYRLD